MRIIAQTATLVSLCTALWFALGHDHQMVTMCVVFAVLFKLQAHEMKQEKK